MREAVAVQMTWPGAPTIYYGDEAGLCGFTDPDNRRSYPWGREDHDLINFHKEMIRIHKENPELKTGSLKKSVSDYNFISYARFNKEEQTLVVVNNNQHEMTKELTVWEYGVGRETTMERIMLTHAGGYTTEKTEYPVSAGKVQVTLPPTSVLILKHRN